MLSMIQLQIIFVVFHHYF